MQTVPHDGFNEKHGKPADGVPVLQFFISSPSSPGLVQLSLDYSWFVQPQGKKAKAIAWSHNKRLVLSLQGQIPLSSQSSMHCTMGVKYLGADFSSMSFEVNQSLKYLEEQLQDNSKTCH